MHSPAIVVSDIHLGAVPDRVEREFIGFLRSWPTEAEVLLINGDLFDFWFEYRTVIPGAHFDVLRMLAGLRERGVRVMLVGGNHDAWGGSFLTREIGIELIEGPAEVEIGGRRALVAHGDGVGPGDTGYKMLRRVLRSSPIRSMMRLVHPDLAQRIADRISRTESRTERDRRRAVHRAKILREHAKRVLSERPELELVIFGHCHIPELIEVEPGRHYINSGDWTEHRTVTFIGPETVEQRDWDAPASSGGARSTT